MSSIDQVIDSALALADGDRMMLIEAMLASLRPQDRPPFDEAWRSIIERRSQELESGQVKGIAWDAVKQHAREQSGD